MLRFAALAFILTITISIAREKTLKQHLLENEQGGRDFLNNHVILIEKEGTAIEPYDYYTGGWFIKRNIATPLQVRNPGQDDGTKKWKEDYSKWMAARASAGLPPAEPTSKAEAGRRAEFVFRDEVVPRMLDRAEASGLKPLVFIHGGMNTLKGAIERAAILTPLMIKDGYYPIFICWNSSLTSSWRQHIFSARNGLTGKGDSRLFKALTAPTYLATDIAVAVARLPRTLLDLTRSSTKPHAQYYYSEVTDSLARYFSLRAARAKVGGEVRDDDMIREQLKLEAHTGLTVDALSANLTRGWTEIVLDKRSRTWMPMDVSQGTNDVRWGMDTFWRQVGGWGLFPSKLLVMGAFSGVGTEAWGVMLRRVEAMFHHEKSFQPRIAQKKKVPGYSEADPDVRHSDSTGIGALAVFWREVEARQKSGRLRNLMLIGHSMGAIVSNRTLIEFPKLGCERIVYMAAAASILDSYISLVPYLDGHKGTHFYNLCLHPRAEEREGSWKQRWWGEFVPRGSLLVWIDEFLNNPHSMPERTMGSFENALLGSSLFPPRVQGQMHMTALSVGANLDEQVQMHGDFGNYRFWKPGFATDPGTVPRSVKYPLQENTTGGPRRK